MAKNAISTPKAARIDARQRYEPKTRSGISIFARAAANGTPTRNITRGNTGPKTIAPAVRARILKQTDDSNAAGRSGGKHHSPSGRAGLALGTKTVGRIRGASLWKSGLDFENTLAGVAHAEEENIEDESNGYDDRFGEGNLLPEDSDVEWEDERTLIDDLMGLDDESEQNKTKRQEALTDTLRGHFNSLSISVKQDLFDAVVPVIDNLTTTATLLQKGPDDDYKDGFIAFDDSAYEHLDTIRTVNEELGQLKDESLTRLRHAVGKIDAERTKRTELCEAFKTSYMRIYSRAQDRLAHLVAKDVEQVITAVENRGNAIMSGKDKDKEKMRQKILKAFA